MKPKLEIIRQAKFDPQSISARLLYEFIIKFQVWVDTGYLIRRVPNPCLSTFISRINSRMRRHLIEYKIVHRVSYQGTRQFHYYRLEQA